MRERKVKKERVLKHGSKRPRNTNTTTRSTTERERLGNKRGLLPRVVERNTDTITDPPNMVAHLSQVGRQLRNKENMIKFRMTNYVCVYIFLLVDKLTVLLCA